MISIVLELVLLRYFVSPLRLDSIWNSYPTNLLDINIGLGQCASGLETWLFGCAYT